MNSNGQIFLISAIILVGLILSVTYFTGQKFIEVPRENYFLKESSQELNNAYFYGIANNDLNASLWKAGKAMSNIGLAAGFITRVRYIAFDQNDSFVAGNFSEVDCEISGTGFSSINVTKNNTVIFDKDTLLKNYNVSFCGRNYDLNQYIQYYAETIKGKEVGVWENLGKQT